MRRITKSEKAYYAGYFDGEGHVRIQHSSPQATISTCCPHIVRALRDIYGGSLRLYKSTNAKWRDAYRWWICGQKAHKFLASIHPFSREKKKQIGLALRYRTQSKAVRYLIKVQMKKLRKETYE